MYVVGYLVGFDVKFGYVLVVFVEDGYEVFG